MKMKCILFQETVYLGIDPIFWTECIHYIYPDGLESTENRLRKVVDVRDVANALLLAYEKPESEGRYICASHMIKVRDLVEKLKSIYPYYNYPKR